LKNESISKLKKIVRDADFESAESGCFWDTGIYLQLSEICNIEFFYLPPVVIS
jgi:hypothetical protein